MSDSATPRSVAQGMARLKELLFDSEVETIGNLDQRLSSIEEVNAKQAREQLENQRRVEQLFERAGTEERFRSSVAVVLDKALQDAELHNHDEMSRAIAPLVINTVKTELKNSQDELVDIMFPITGRMVKSYIAAEMKKLSESVNSQIDNNPMMLRLRSVITRKPVSDLAIAQSQRLAVDEIFLIRRGSGELLAHWPPSPNAMSNADVHMSGFLAAINDFASSTFGDEGGNFESFNYEDFTVYMRGSPVYLLAAKCSGVAPSGIDQIFNDEFLATIERVAALEKAASNQAAISADKRSLELQPMAETVETRTGKIYDEIADTKIGGAVVKLLLFLIAVPLLAWFFWGLYTDAEEALVRRAARQVIAGSDELKGYQTGLDVGYRGRSITLTGLAPDRPALRSLETALGKELPGVDVKMQMAVIPSKRIEMVPALAPVDTTELERRLSQRVEAVENQLLAASAERAVGRADARLRQAVPELDRLEAEVREPDKKADIREVRTAVQKTRSDIAALKAKIRAAGSDRGKLEGLSGTMNSASAAITSAIRSLVSIHGGAQSSGVLRRPAAATPVEAAEDLTSEAERLATLVIALNQTMAMLPEPVTIPDVTISPDERLRQFVERNALFFSSGTDYLSAPAANKILDDLAGLIKKTTRLVRVVGFTDEKGAAARNSTLAQNRADRVTADLVARGVAPERLISIGRPEGFHLTPGAGTASPNRRVEFELGFYGEARSQP